MNTQGYLVLPARAGITRYVRSIGDDRSQVDYDRQKPFTENPTYRELGLTAARIVIRWQSASKAAVIINQVCTAGVIVDSAR